MESFKYVLLNLSSLYEIKGDFMLPYKYPFTTCLEIQAKKPPQGRYAHENHPEARYAIDFILPLGTPILAARKGTVVVAKHDSDRYISDMTVIEQMSLEQLIEFSAKYTNGVCIQHNDGTFTEYIHLDLLKIVEEGQEVEEEQPIGYCGMSGLTTQPHLHFNVFKLEDGKVKSIPFEFSGD